MAASTLYEVLMLHPTATNEVINAVYRVLAKKYHPDRNPGNRQAEDTLKGINEAYEILSDPEKRANYDRWGTADFQGINMDGFGDIFSEIFRGFPGFGDFGFGRRGRAGPPPGQTLRVTIPLSFEDAFFGVEREIAFNRQIHCESCKGTGASAGSSPRTCPTCRGRGQVMRSMGGFMSVSQTCPSCGGAGEVVDTPCKECRGKGLQKERREIKVPIPPGVEDGQALRIRGGGSAGSRGGPHGDLILVFAVEPHDTFIRKGLHVYMEMEIPFSLAVFGGETEVPTMRGLSKMKVGKTTHGGTIFRMKGKGVHSDDGRKGDQLVRVAIQIPKKLNKEQKKYLRDFDSVFG